MGLLSLLVIRQMNDRMIELADAQVKADRAQDMLYAVTAQSHYRAMALLLPERSRQVQRAGRGRQGGLRPALGRAAGAEPANAAFYEGVRTVNDGYRQSGEQVVALMDEGRTEDARQIHLDEEHPTSHTLEERMRTLIATAKEDMAGAQSDFRSAHDLFTGMVIAFSAASVIVALVLGFALSWAFILPVRKMEYALAESPRATSTSASTSRTATSSEAWHETSTARASGWPRCSMISARLATRLRETNASLERTSEAKSRPDERQP